MDTKRIVSNSHPKGFTTIELITIVVISGIIVGILSQLMAFSADTFEFMGNRKESLHESRLAVHYLNRDLRKIRDMNSITIAGDSQFQYYDYDNNLVDLKYQNSTIDRNGNALASNVSSFLFNYIRTDGGYMTKPVASDSLEFIWDIEARFTVTVENHAVEYRVIVHPRSYR